MRVALLQHNPVIGSIPYNLKKIIDCVVKKHHEADLFVTAELALTGYPPKDLIAYPEIYQSEVNALEELKKLTEKYSVGIIVGHHLKLENENRFFNCASLLAQGKLIGTVKKQKLPSYNIFEEERFYIPGRDNPPYIEFLDKKIGISLCEDLWDKVYAFGEKDARHYPQDLNPIYHQKDADLLINLSASPFRINKDRRRLETLCDIARKTKKPSSMLTLLGLKMRLFLKEPQEPSTPKAKSLPNVLLGKKAKLFSTWKKLKTSLPISRATGNPCKTL